MSVDAANELNAITEALLNYTGTPDAALFLGGHGELTRNMILNVSAQLRVLAAGDTTTNPNEYRQTVQEELHYHTTAVLSKPLSKPYCAFLSNLALLIVNWNNNTIKSPDIQKDATYIQRFVSGHLTMMEAIMSLSTQIETMRNMHSQYNQPVQLARHYLSSLDEKFRPKPVSDSKSSCCAAPVREASPSDSPIQSPGIKWQIEI